MRKSLGEVYLQTNNRISNIHLHLYTPSRRRSSQSARAPAPSDRLDVFGALGAAWGLDDDIVSCAEKANFCSSLTTSVKSLMTTRVDHAGDEESATSMQKTDAQQLSRSQMITLALVVTMLLSLIACEMSFDVPESFQLAWRGVFVFVSLSYAVTQMDL